MDAHRGTLSEHAVQFLSSTQKRLQPYERNTPTEIQQNKETKTKTSNFQPVQQISCTKNTPPPPKIFLKFSIKHDKHIGNKIITAHRQDIGN